MIRQLDVPIYDTNVLFLLETTGEEWAHFCDNEVNKEKLTEEEIKDVFDELSNEKWAGSVLTLINNGGYISIIKDPNRIFYHTHELFHLADSILKDRGVEYTENNEALAYMVGWINEQYSYLLKEFNEENEDKRDK